MKYKTPDKNIFTFKQEDGKWKMYISGSLAFYMETTHGIPLEITEEYVNALPKEKKLIIAVENWKRFVALNNIAIHG